MLRIAISDFIKEFNGRPAFHLNRHQAQVRSRRLHFICEVKGISLKGSDRDFPYGYSKRMCAEQAISVLTNRNSSRKRQISEEKDKQSGGYSGSSKISFLMNIKYTIKLIGADGYSYVRFWTPIG